MKNKKINFVLALASLALATLACNTLMPSKQSATPYRLAPPAQTTLSLPQVQQPQVQGSLPLTEADVPRVSAADAKAAFDSGEAVIVDVRGAQFFAGGHAKGAISIPLLDIENDPAHVNLDKTQWIITYCT
jgi:hypothetical protein